MGLQQDIAATEWKSSFAHSADLRKGVDRVRVKVSRVTAVIDSYAMYC